MLTGFFRLNIFRVFLIALATSTLIGCSLEEDLLGDSSGGAPINTSETVTVSGSVGDGPVTGATVNVYSSQGTLLGSFVSDSKANYQARVKARGNEYPLRLEASGGIDLVTGKAPDFRMISVMAHPSVKTANINPHSTLIVKVAEQSPGGLDAGKIDAAKAMVMGSLSFGLNSNQVPDLITSAITDNNIADIVKASESMGEVIRRTRDLMATAGRPLDGDAVMTVLAADMSDGVLDGQGGNAADATIAAVANVVSGQVLVEALSNNLRVDGMVATGMLDQSIMTTHPDVSAGQLSASVPISAGMLEQARTAVAAARVLDVSSPLASIAIVLDSLTANTSIASVAAVLPADSSLAMDGVAGMTPYASLDDINAVNAVVAADGNANPVNTPPVISGSPATSVTAGECLQLPAKCLGCRRQQPDLQH